MRVIITCSLNSDIWIMLFSYDFTRILDCILLLSLVSQMCTSLIPARLGVKNSLWSWLHYKVPLICKSPWRVWKLGIFGGKNKRSTNFWISLSQNYVKTRVIIYSSCQNALKISWHDHWPSSSASGILGETCFLVLKVLSVIQSASKIS